VIERGDGVASIISNSLIDEGACGGKRNGRPNAGQIAYERNTGFSGRQFSSLSLHLPTIEAGLNVAPNAIEIRPLQQDSNSG